MGQCGHSRMDGDFPPTVTTSLYPHSCVKGKAKCTVLALAELFFGHTLKSFDMCMRVCAPACDCKIMARIWSSCGPQLPRHPTCVQTIVIEDICVKC